MRFEDLFLFCFFVGSVLSVVSFLAGRFHIHLPHKWHIGHGGHGGHGGGHGAGACRH